MSGSPDPEVPPRGSSRVVPSVVIAAVVAITSAVALILRGLWLLLIPIAMSAGICIGTVIFLSRGALRLHPDDPPPKRSPWVLPIGLTIFILLLLFGPIGLFVWACNREWANY
jgi:hypothetical protein